MAIDAPEVGTPTQQHDDWRATFWRWWRRLVVLSWLALLLAATFAGEKESHLQDLEAALHDGHVSHVEVTGVRDPVVVVDPGTPSERPWSGGTMATLRWEGRFIDRYAEVYVTQGDTDAPVPSWALDLPPVHGKVGELLRGIDRDVQLIHVDHVPPDGWRTVFMSWRVPEWLGALGVAAWLATLMLITGGPEPWRATRAAWFWLVLLGGSIGVAAFIVLGGPLGLGRPREGSRRLTGGWAFLLALFIGGGRT